MGLGVRSTPPLVWESTRVLPQGRGRGLGRGPGGSWDPPLFEKGSLHPDPHPKGREDSTPPRGVGVYQGVYPRGEVGTYPRYLLTSGVDPYPHLWVVDPNPQVPTNKLEGRSPHEKSQNIELLFQVESWCEV